MKNRDKIRILEDQHRRLDSACYELERLRELDRSEDMKFKLQDLKKKKLAVKDEIAFLMKSELAEQEAFDFENYER